MYALITGLALCLVIQQDAGNDLSNLCKKFAEVEGYTFEMVSKNDFGGMGGSGRGADSQEPGKTTGKYQKGKPFYMKSNTLEAFRDGGACVYREGKEKWQLFDMESMRRGPRGGARGGRGEEPGEGRGRRGERRPRRGQGGDDEDKPRRGGSGEGEGRPPRGERGEGGTRRGRGEDMGGRGGFRAMRNMFTLSRMNFPHEALKKVEGKVKEIKCKKEEGKLVYTAVLTKEGAEALAGTSRMGGRRGGSFKRSGTIKIVATPEGAIKKIEIATQMSGAFGEREFKRTNTNTFEMKEIGNVEIAVPKEVSSKLTL